MDDEERRVKVLLTRAADAAGPFEAPPVERLTAHRSRGRSFVAVCTVAAAVVALVVGLSATAALHGGGRATAPSHSLPGPAGPTVSVSALQKYRWTALPAAPIPARGAAASAWTGRSLIVWGGETSHNELRNDGASYDPATRTWTQLPAGPLTARAGAPSVWVDGSFVIWGGMARHNLSDGARYDPRTGTWTTLPRAPVTSYRWAQLVAVGDKAVLLTADDNDPGIIHADAYSPGSNTWRAMPDLRTGHTHRILQATALGVGNSVFVWSDWYHSTRPAHNTVSTASGVDTYALDVRTGTWSATSLKPDPWRSAGQPIWTGRQFLLAGEQTYCGPCSTPGGAWLAVAIDPRTGARTRIVTGPLAMTMAGFYWTGSALLAVNLSTEIVGSSHDTYPGDTAAWNPKTNTWTSLASTRPGGGIEAVTAWTGDRLLVWGKGGGSQFAPAGR